MPKASSKQCRKKSFTFTPKSNTCFGLRHQGTTATAIVKRFFEQLLMGFKNHLQRRNFNMVANLGGAFPCTNVKTPALRQYH